MSAYQNEESNAAQFVKLLGVEVNDGDTIMVQVIVDRSTGGIEVNLPEGRRLNQFERWAVQDQIEDDGEIQESIQIGEDEYLHDAWIAARGFSS